MAISVSVIIAAYNVENYIEKCLVSVLNQRLHDIEIIIVNDGSTDNTLEIIKEQTSKDKRVKIVDKQNEGLVEARKSGLSVATGEYLLFVDGDDWLELDALEVLYRKAKSGDYDIVLYNGYLSYDNYKKPFKTYKEILGNDYFQDLCIGSILPSLCFKFVKKSYIEINEIEFATNISYAEDLATTSSLLMCAPNLAFISENLYNYYQRSNSITQTMNRQILEIDSALLQIEQQLKKRKLYTKYKNEFEFMVNRQFSMYFLGEYNSHPILGKELYNMYKKRKIDIYQNRYFLAEMKKSRKNHLRTRIYYFNFSIGKMFDRIIKFIG
ncbi:MAG: glycosyltransferase family 2 protein [Culicoidibacterales bacterium]